MLEFKKAVQGIEFTFKELHEGNDVVFLVSGENQSFRMITDDEGYWGIWQQVPSWIKRMEEELASALDGAYTAQ